MGRKQIFYCLPVEQYCMHILEEDEKGSAYQPPKCRDQNIDWLTKRWERSYLSSLMTLSANQSAMAFQKAQDQKIDQHQQPKVELGNKVKIHCDDTTVPRFKSLMWEKNTSTFFYEWCNSFRLMSMGHLVLIVHIYLPWKKWSNKHLVWHRLPTSQTYKWGVFR